MRSKILLIIARNAVIILLAGIIVFVCFFNINSHNFGIVNEGQIYRSSQPSESFLNRLIEQRKIKTIAVLKHSVPGFEKNIATSKGIRIIQIKMSASKEPSAGEVEKFLEIINNPDNYPILVHCHGGADRTGLMIAIKRVEVDGWTVDEAEKEMFFYRNIPILTPMPKRFLEQWFKTEH